MRGGSLIFSLCGESAFAVEDMGQQRMESDGKREMLSKEFLAASQDFFRGSDAHISAGRCSAKSPLILSCAATGRQHGLGRQTSGLKIAKQRGTARKQGLLTTDRIGCVSSIVRPLLCVPTHQTSEIVRRSEMRSNLVTSRLQQCILTESTGTRQSYMVRSFAPDVPNCLLISRAAAGGNAMVSADWPSCRV